MDNMTGVRILALTVSVVMLVINTLILREMFLLKARGCNCATDEWRRIFIIVSMFIFIAAFFVAMVKTFIPTVLLLLWIVVAGLVAWTNIFITRQFINRMKDKNCECATERSVFKLMNVVNWIQIIIAIGIVIWLLVYITMYSAPNRNATPAASGQPQINARQLSKTPARGRATSGSR
jgi:hypothetical protein